MKSKQDVELSNLGRGDFTLDMYGWRESEQQFRNYLKTHQTEAIIQHRWFPAAHIDHYLAQPNNLPLHCVGDTNEIHEYVEINKHRKQLKSGQNACYITTSNFFEPVPAHISRLFQQVEKPVFLPIHRNHKVIKYLIVYRLVSYLKGGN